MKKRKMTERKAYSENYIELIAVFENMSDFELLSRTETAQFLHMSERGIERLKRENILKPYVICRKHYYRLGELRAFRKHYYIAYHEVYEDADLPLSKKEQKLYEILRRYDYFEESIKDKHRD